MRIAISVFGNRISPRFDCAPVFGLFDTEGKKVIRSSNVPCDGWGEVERISRLKELGVDTLICGGLPSHLFGILTNNGIKVIPWIAGNAGEALSLFLRDRLEQGMILCPGRGRGRRCGRVVKSQE